MAKITDKTLKNPKPEDIGRELADDLLPNFYPYIIRPGIASFRVRYRLRGSKKKDKFTLRSRYPEISLADARELAREVLRKVERGEDPKAEEGPTPPHAPVDTLATIVPLFIERHAKPNNRSWRDIERLLRSHIVSSWGDRRIGDIRRRDALELRDSIGETSGKVTANRVRSWASKLWNWSRDRGYIDDNPWQGIKPYKEKPRERVLEDNELLALWLTAGSFPTYGAILKLLILTGQRRAEVAGMERSELDLERRVWSIPSSRRKGEDSHEVPLSDMAAEIIGAVPRIHPTLLFPTHKFGSSNHISGWSKWKSSLDARSGVSGFTIHDIRRSVATLLQRKGFHAEIVEECLGHRSGGARTSIALVYQKHRFESEKRLAMDAIARHVRSLLELADDEEKVVTLRVR